MTRISAATTALAMIVLTGCSTPFSGPEAGPTPRTVTTSSSPTPTPSATPYRVPNGKRMITAKKSGLRFAVPSSWTKLDATKLADPASKAEMGRFAASRNLTLTQFRQMLTQLDLIALSSTATRATYGELNVVPLAPLAEIPTRAALREQFKALNITVLAFHEVSTPLGKGLVVDSRSPNPGSGSFYGTGLFVQANNGIVNLSVTALTQARTQELMRSIIPSLQDVGRGGSAGPGTTVGG